VNTLINFFRALAPFCATHMASYTILTICGVVTLNIQVSIGCMQLDAV
jgi:hypothetical protein